MGIIVKEHLGGDSGIDRPYRSTKLPWEAVGRAVAAPAALAAKGPPKQRGPVEEARKLRQGQGRGQVWGPGAPHLLTGDSPPPLGLWSFQSYLRGHQPQVQAPLRAPKVSQGRVKKTRGGYPSHRSILRDPGESGLSHGAGTHLCSFSSGCERRKKRRRASSRESPRRKGASCPAGREGMGRGEGGLDE